MGSALDAGQSSSFLIGPNLFSLRSPFPQNSAYIKEAKGLIFNPLYLFPLIQEQAAFFIPCFL
jgi:hypothetical protein